MGTSPGSGTLTDEAGGRLGAVLPLSIRGSYNNDDLGRADILFRSLAAFVSPGTLGHFLIVTPPDEVDVVTERCARWRQFDIEVISEEELVPEFRAHRQVRGWRKQQIVKLAAARHLTEDFFITFDADVICLRPISSKDLIVDGRALIQYELRDQHPKWWRSSARLLDMSPDVGDPSEGMTVTPAVLAAALCRQVARDLDPPDDGTWVDRLCAMHNPRRPSNWTLHRHRRARWTEYSLYYLCAMKHGLLDDYHVRAGSDEVPQLLLVHDSHPFETWNPATSFAADAPGLFCVVGSKSGLEPEAVWRKVAPYIPNESGRASD